MDSFGAFGSGSACRKKSGLSMSVVFRRTRFTPPGLFGDENKVESGPRD